MEWELMAEKGGHIQGARYIAIRSSETDPSLFGVLGATKRCRGAVLTEIILRRKAFGLHGVQDTGKSGPSSTRCRLG